MTREEAIKKLKGAINLLVEFCHFATDSILCEELEDVVKYLEIDLHNAEKLHKPTKYEPLYYAKIKGWDNPLNKQSIKYWNYDFEGDEIFHGDNRESNLARTKLTKSKWEKLGINVSNADFEEVEE